MTHIESQAGPPTGAPQVGKILLIGSGETSASAHEMYQQVFETLPQPVRVAILETPAGFELNSALVAQKIADFLKVSMKNFSPSVRIVPARHKQGLFSTNSRAILEPVLDSNFVYVGAGSPTYAVGNLRDSLAYQYLVRRHLMGAAICLASAGAISFGSKTLPVYEIYKAGHELHWVNGLDFLGPFGLDLAIVTHWNNKEGGAQLDTSRCFMGRSRMAQLVKLLPATTTVLGIDEHTGLIMDFRSERCRIVGKGRATVLGRGTHETFDSGTSFPIETLGPYRLPAQVSGTVASAQDAVRASADVELPQMVATLVERREKLRRVHDWSEADLIRRQIADLGFEIQDTKDGPLLRQGGATIPKADNV